ncbi:MAG: periplasmic heavy metal sensor [Pseudomonadota bacterium]
MHLNRPWAIVLIVALLLSVVANFFTVGALFATWRFAASTPAGLSAIAELRQRIPEEARPHFREAFLGNREQLRPAFKALGDARRVLEAAIRAEPYEAEAVAAALDEVGARSAELQIIVHEVLLTAVSELPDDVRRELDLSARGPAPGGPLGMMLFGPPPGALPPPD